MARSLRRQNWPTMLAIYFAAHEATQFGWGSWDCVHAATGAVEAMTGTDLLGDLRGAYSSREEASIILGGHGLEDRVVDVLGAAGLTEIPLKSAQRGDLVLVDVHHDEGSEDLALGVVDLRGTHAAVASVSGGWAYLRLQKYATRAWRVH